MKCFPDSFIYRLPDQVSGYKQTSANPCDFLCFTNRKLFLVECKEHKGKSIPFAAIRQYEKLISYIGKPDVHAGVVIWFSELDLVIWVPAEELKKMVADGEKSVGVRHLEKKLYNIITIPSSKKRLFMESDYAKLLEVYK